MPNNLRLSVLKSFKVITWVLIAVIACVSWMFLLVDAETENCILWPMFLTSKGLPYTLVFTAIIAGLIVMIFLMDKWQSLKIPLIASCVGFLAEVARGILIGGYISPDDGCDICLCIGLLNHWYGGISRSSSGKSCALLGQSCAAEIFLLTFFVVLVIGTARLVKSKYYNTSKT